mmetsp:Transcript_30529/g.58788  ORF Transcript_30529/g.58788 Transcript_30529/m.58788 type:complete len:246 (+) Transcript_30529:332-1069(+)|eukprot:CAMPEP_0114256900 /NCGR_PEP_ID=MMETSP0058-20121206/18427_1 /TAXON_ID=36894 /ORGANISM="Pyramimonas parkeae, CCMP726" /LENGTH=245 /DNA_ID=CAMNT_0001371553 /DNA_START=324 /DNA_END=1061 /DNA_ORIENTATION=+
MSTNQGGGGPAAGAAETHASEPTGARWLIPRLHSEKGARQVLKCLQSCVSQVSFTKRLSDAQVAAKSVTGSETKSVANVSQQEQSSEEDEDLASFGDLPTEENAQALLHHMEEKIGCKYAEDASFLDTSFEDSDEVNFEKECVIIGPSDVIDAMADFITRCVVKHPKASTLSPEKLQVALEKTIAELQRNPIKRSLWEWTLSLYRGAAFSYGVANAYTHPWIVKAVLVGMWQSIKMIATAIPLGI